MNLQDWASIAEIIGGFAVLATLIYLIMEVRDNTRTLKAKATTAAVTGWSEFNAMLSQHPERVVAAQAFLPQGSLDNFDPAEQVTLDFLGRSILHRFLASFFLYEAGIMDAEAWTQQITYCHSFLALPVWAAWWKGESKQPIYSSDFLSAIESAPTVKLNIGNPLVDEEREPR
jgi:hypothetical protein